MDEQDISRIAAELRSLSPAEVKARKTALARQLFFDAELMPEQIEQLTGVAANTVRNLCCDDPRYDQQVTRNLRRRGRPHPTLAEFLEMQSRSRVYHSKD